ncbi:phenylalanyl-tRNA synthetase alpha chain B, putative [Entamoeba dispar SAW760]|uniref:phenylalanine--tRNA ligase n=1 Tax=Entamoeba dispar (strain ATCC PRA-260 / SAW760) TaxID=370354 RepID=B0ERP0_ENTDS|nr:phenylalanyl-tRNA synthetase alpha chain B, putative [Entamoeba dispar SAW760]EDR22803.1 phenylalanyl-tRNA synthetase alpha chain B, putative [Entamoeba dispar SAW760]|eukprot:EDR22803.1 phenylalanyl-tRNA synthetase alpha chain B, putative [Entamoeba dispar SAW760]
MSAKDLILSSLEKEPQIESAYGFAEKNKLAYDNSFIGAIRSLDAAGIIISEMKKVTKQTVSANAEDVLKNGSEEFRLFNLIKKEGTPKAEVEQLPFYRTGFAEAMKLKLIKINGPNLVRIVDTFEDSIQKSLKEVLGGRAATKNEEVIFKRRKFLRQETITDYILKQGPSFNKRSKPVANLTAEMLLNGSWKDANWKEYNFNALGVYPKGGSRHQLSKVRMNFKNIFLEMGFEEMKTDMYVESSFWNFDSLYQPQQHPARDAQDTFFLNEPATTSSADMNPDYVARVKKVHTTGDFGSIGWRSDWKVEEAQKTILRTHTTAVSSRTLAKLAADAIAKGEPFKPIKCFSIDRVFRNETVDQTHLAEFHQIEGFIADRNIGLPQLIAVIKEFFTKMGLPDVRFKPAYNPYTEPSMEIFAYHPGLGKFVEVGNSGVFRPEMLRTMGVPEDITVIAWGFGLERPTMISYGIKSIRSIFGPKTDLDFIKNSEICTYGI